MDGFDAMKGLNLALRNLSQARADLQDRVTAALAFRAALTGKAYDFTAGAMDSAEGVPKGVARARRHELETSLDCLRDLEASVDSARRAVNSAERMYQAERQARPGRPRQGA